VAIRPIATPNIVASAPIATLWVRGNRYFWCCNRGKSIATPKRVVGQTFPHGYYGNACQQKISVVILSFATIFGILQRF